MSLGQKGYITKYKLWNNCFDDNADWSFLEGELGPISPETFQQTDPILFCTLPNTKYWVVCVRHIIVVPGSPSSCVFPIPFIRRQTACSSTSEGFMSGSRPHTAPTCSNWVIGDREQ